MCDSLFSESQHRITEIPEQMMSSICWVQIAIYMRIVTVSLTSDLLAMHTNSTACTFYWGHVHKGTQQFVLGIITPTNANSHGLFTVCLVCRTTYLYHSAAQAWFVLVTDVIVLQGYLLINLNGTFFEPTVGLRPNFAP